MQMYFYQFLIFLSYHREIAFFIIWLTATSLKQMFNLDNQTPIPTPNTETSLAQWM